MWRAFGAQSTAVAALSLLLAANLRARRHPPTPQFNSTSLNRHMTKTYNFGNGMQFGGGNFVEVRLPLHTGCLAVPETAPVCAQRHA